MPELTDPTNFTDFATLNQPLISALRNPVLAPRLERAQGDVRRFMDDLGATAMTALPHPLMIDDDDHARLVDAGRVLIEAQTLLLDRLLTENSPAKLLQFFALPPVLADLIDPAQLKSSERLIARLDVLPTSSGYQFCEFNVDTSISGFEFFECARLLCDGLGLDWMHATPSPLDQIAALVAGEFENGEFDRVVICDWSSRIGVGYFGFDLLRDAIEKAIPRVPVHLVYHDGYPDDWLTLGAGQRTLIYRGFMYEDIDDDLQFVRRLTASGARIVNLFETEIRTHKQWFSIFWDETYRCELSPRMLRAIDEYVPRTISVTVQNVEELLVGRADWVFKYGFSSGGHDVIMGGEHAADALREQLFSREPGHGLDGWVAQRRVETTGVVCGQSPGSPPARLEVVLGLYMYGESANGHGLNIRADAGSNVVNIHQSAASGWAIPMSGPGRLRATAIPPAVG